MPPISSTAAPNSTYDFGTQSTDSSVASVIFGERTLSDFARNRNLDLDSLLKANPQISYMTELTPGQEIRLPVSQAQQTPAANSQQVSGNQASASAQPRAPIGDPLAESAIKATLNAKANAQSGEKLPPDEQFMRSQYGEDGLRIYQEKKKEVQEDNNLPADERMIKTLQGKEALPAYREQKKEVQREFTEARRVYEITGKVPPSLKHWAPIEIEKGTLIPRAERYDLNLAQQGLSPSHQRIDDRDVDPRYLTRDEDLGEWKARMHKGMDACEDEFIRPGKIEKCQRDVAKRFGGPEYMAQHDAKVRDFVERTGQYVEGIKNSGPVGLAGRGVGRAIGYGVGYATGGKERADKWADKGEEWGATVTGPADAAVQGYGAARGEAYQPSSVNSDPVAETAPPPSKNVSETQPDKPAGAGTPPPPKNVQEAPLRGHPLDDTYPLPGNARQDQPATPAGNPTPAPAGGNRGRPLDDTAQQQPATADTSSPSASAQGTQSAPRPTHIEARPIEATPRPADNQRLSINKSNGSKEEMTAGEYRSRYKNAEQWVSKQLNDHQWGGRNGPAPKLDELNRQAAEKFGLDQNWRSVGNPIIYGGT